MAKIDGRILTIGAIGLLLILFILVPMLTKKSGYDLNRSNLPLFNSKGSTDQVQTNDVGGRVGINGTLDGLNAAQFDETLQNPQEQTAQVDGTTNMSSSLLPKEIPSTEDFATFSPEVIMAGQNYLDPRSQIGYPETLGGVLRNANYDLRSEPVNSRTPVSIWNNSTIVPDLMRPQFEIGR